MGEAAQHGYIPPERMGMMIKDMLKLLRYDVGLVSDYPDGSHAEVWWSTDVDMLKVSQAVIELLVMKEKDPIAFTGNIVIRPTESTPVPYHGRECEEDIVDGSGRVVGRLPTSGRDEPRKGECDYCAEPHFTEDHHSIWRQQREARSVLKQRLAELKLDIPQDDWKKEAVGPYVLIEEWEGLRKSVITEE
jgi:hypothetical protein